MLDLIKRYGVRAAIKSLNKMEKYTADMLRDWQERFGKIDPDTFAKAHMDGFQLKLCTFFKIDPKGVVE